MPLESQGIPQERISERIVEQIVPLPQVLPQERTPERIVEQIVPAPQVIPQKRISERILEPTIDEGRGTSSSSAVTLDAAECSNDGVFSHFSLRKKSAKIGRESSANLVSHSSSWPPAAYQEEEAGYYYFDFENMAWRRRLTGSESTTGSSLMAAGRVLSQRPLGTCLCLVCLVRGAEAQVLRGGGLLRHGGGYHPRCQTSACTGSARTRTSYCWPE